MPKLSHEALVQLVRGAPKIVVDLLRSSLGLQLPVRARARVTAAELTDQNLAEHRADAVLTLGEPVQEVFVVEAQGNPDPEKREVWPLYLAGMRARWRCPATLVVIAPDAKVAAWCRKPIDLGRGRCVLRPLVLGPREVPVIKDVEAARAAPELAVLSVAAHGQEPGAEHIARAAILACRTLDRRRANLYADFTYALLGKVARMALEKLLDFDNWEPQSPWFRKPWLKAKREERAKARAEGRAEGLAEGRAEGRAKERAKAQAKAQAQLAQLAQLLLTLLGQRKFRVTAAVRARIEGCKSRETLMRWAGRVVTARRLADVFADDER